MEDDTMDATATQRLLDELIALDGADDNASLLQLLALSPVGDTTESLLSNPLPPDVQSPTAQFLTFFAAPDESLTQSLTDASVDSSSTCFDPDVPSIASTSLVPSRKAKLSRRSSGASNYHSNRARNERRHELAYLRRKVADMERELAAKKDATLANILSGGHLLKSPQHHRSVSARDGVWAQIAGRQKDERRRAERENVRLRAALETQLKVAKSLELLLNKPTIVKSLDSIGLGGLITSRAVLETTIDRAVRADRVVLQSLLQHVEEIYAHIDTLMSESVSPPSAGIRTASRGSLVEIFATDRMPFPLEAASTAAWKYFSYKKNYLPIPSRLYYERHDSTTDSTATTTSIEDTVLESSGMERIANGLTAIVKIQQVLRRYATPDRVVIVWSALSQPVEFAGQPFSGYDLREWGCMVLQPAGRQESEECSMVSPFTVLRSYFFITPEFKRNEDGEGDSGEYDIGRLTECCLAFTMARMSSWRQRIENILLDQLVAAH